MSQPISVIDANAFQETLRKVQKERDHYRSETARLRTENASLLNEVDTLKARLSDIDGEKFITEAVDAQCKASFNHIQKKVELELEDIASTFAGESCCGSSGSPTDAQASSLFRNHKTADEPSGATIALDESGRNVSIHSNEQSEALESAAMVDWASSFSPATSRSEVFEEPSDPPDTVSMYSKESPSYPFYRGNNGNFLTLSAERIAGCLENTQHISCHPPCPPVGVSRHFLSQLIFASAGGMAKLQVPASYNRTTTRHLLLGSEYLYFPITSGSPGLVLSCRQELIKGTHNWSCFAPMPDITSKQVEYIGEYQLSYVGDLSPEEFNLQTPKAKTKVVRLMFDPPKKQRGVRRDKSDFKVEDKVLLTMMDAFVTGQEKIRIIVMAFVGYDIDFAKYIQAKYASWLSTATSA
ncbi:hypothetical protein BS17DRAFT_783580 [Gyrodon lividus]|nr:hypothetical protein BS17DRAFT_783580 [Gyrodon lividus]